MKFAPVLSLLFLLMFVVTGCTTGRHLQWYAGPSMGSSKTALLKIQQDVMGVALRVNKINGTLLNRGKRDVGNNTRVIELLPGHYDLMVEYMDAAGGHSIQDTPISFIAEAGKVYDLRAAPEERSFGTEMRIDFIGGRFHFDLWISDEESGEVVAGKPREASLHWYEK